jgi:ferric-dicitrate binding protein FerR (iron transport regulator)
MSALADIPAAQIVQYGPETIIEWLIARNEQRSRALRAACQSLREATADQARALENLYAAVSAPVRP